MWALGMPLSWCRSRCLLQGESQDRKPWGAFKNAFIEHSRKLFRRCRLARFVCSRMLSGRTQKWHGFDWPYTATRASSRGDAPLSSAYGVESEILSLDYSIYDAESCALACLVPLLGVLSESSGTPYLVSRRMWPLVVMYSSMDHQHSYNTKYARRWSEYQI